MHPTPVTLNIRLHPVLILGLLSIIVSPRAADAEPNPFELAKSHFAPLPDHFGTADAPVTAERVALGRRLFFDKSLSVDGSVSCETCHLPGLHATDGRSKAVGVENRPNPRNAPTLLNAAPQFRVHWDGARESVEEQATRSLIGPATFGNKDYPAVIAKLKTLGYEKQFQSAFKGQTDPITPENWGKAIGSFERTLVSPAPFDAYLKGNLSALDDRALRGLVTFVEIGCSNCHQGTLLGGTQFQKFGLFGDYASLTGSKEPDEGRFKITQDPGDRFVFKVPPLRNVAMTPPYFHDGSVEDLPSAIRIMGKLQLNRTLSEEEIRNIQSFLESLTGTIPEQFKAPPS